MRLINTKTLVLEEFIGENIPKYAILSHTWRNGEVSYLDWQNISTRSLMLGYKKIKSACRIAERQSVSYIWVDTNCINKESSAELSEAINSMYNWYQRAAICFVFLDDFTYHLDFTGIKNCRWFTRGWTLQELLAPSHLEFFDSQWKHFANKSTLAGQISTITGIQLQYLLQPEAIGLASIAKKMSWGAKRCTTREEDMAYCLMGLFDINMPLLYGEGRKAFIRLQEEILRQSNDHTIFCWSWHASEDSEKVKNWHGCLAPSPANFLDGTHYAQTGRASGSIGIEFQITNGGLRIELPLLSSATGKLAFAVLNASDARDEHPQVALCLEKIDARVYARSSALGSVFGVPGTWAGRGEVVYLVHERNPERRSRSLYMNYPYTDSWFLPDFSILPVSSNSIVPLQLESHIMDVQNYFPGSRYEKDYIRLQKDGPETVSSVCYVASGKIKYAQHEIRLNLNIQISTAGKIQWSNDTGASESNGWTSETTAKQNVSLQFAPIIRNRERQKLVLPIFVSSTTDS